MDLRLVAAADSVVVEDNTELVARAEEVLDNLDNSASHSLAHQEEVPEVAVEVNRQLGCKADGMDSLAGIAQMDNGWADIAHEFVQQVKQGL